MAEVVSYISTLSKHCRLSLFNLYTAQFSNLPKPAKINIVWNYRDIGEWWDYNNVTKIPDFGITKCSWTAGRRTHIMMNHIPRSGSADQLDIVVHSSVTCNKKAKSNLSLLSLYYVEACNEFAEPISASYHPPNTAFFEEMSQRWQAVGNTVSDLTGSRSESHTSAQEINALPLNQTEGK